MTVLRLATWSLLERGFSDVQHGQQYIGDGAAADIWVSVSYLLALVLVLVSFIERLPPSISLIIRKICQHNLHEIKKTLGDDAILIGQYRIVTRNSAYHTR